MTEIDYHWPLNINKTLRNNSDNNTELQHNSEVIQRVKCTLQHSVCAMTQQQQFTDSDKATQVTPIRAK